MSGFILRRLGLSVVVLFGAVSISFFLTNVVGDPADVVGGTFMTDEQRAALNAVLGYDQPLMPRFVGYVTGIFVGDFGTSYRTNNSAMALVLNALPNTLILIVVSLAIATTVALALAIFSARNRETRRDRTLRRTIGALQGMPDFWIALMLILLFSVQLSMFPSFGFTGLASLVLPVTAIALPIIPTLFRLLRGQLLDVLSSEFVEAMQARGLSERVIIYRHALLNMAGPAATWIALQMGYLISGSFIVETIFSWPGIGQLMVTSVTQRDFAVVQSVMIVVAAIYVVLNLVADLVVLLVDPRVRTGSVR